MTENSMEDANGDSGDSVVVIGESNIAREPDLLPSAVNPEEGVENPIIRLENPHYDEEASAVLPTLDNVNISGEESSPSCCRTSPNSRKRSFDDMNQSDDESAACCPICMDRWTASGPHRLCSLKCGHLFGKSCLRRWLIECRKYFCPTCNAKARRSDIRDLYACKVVAVDDTQLQNYKRLYEAVLEDRKRIEIELRRVQLELKDKSGTTETGSVLSAEQSLIPQCLNQPEVTYTYSLDESSVRLNEATVMAYNPLWDLAAVSDKSTMPLWPGYGVRVIKARSAAWKDFKVFQKRIIRAMAFHPTASDYLLVASLDNAVRIVDISSSSSSVLLSFEEKNVQLACCWDLLSTDHFYVGNSCGDVKMYNMTQPAEAPVVLPREEFENTPVVSLYFSAKHNALLVCRVGTVTLYKKTSPKTFVRYAIPVVAGSFADMCSDENFDHVIIAYRPQGSSTSIHYVYTVTVNLRMTEALQLEGDVQCHRRKAFAARGRASSKSSKSCLFVNAQHRLYFAFDETNQEIAVWYLDRTKRVLSIKVTDPILQLLCIERSSNTLQLFALSQQMYKSYTITCP